MFNDLSKVTKLAQEEAHIKKPVFSDCRYLFYLPGCLPRMPLCCQKRVLYLHPGQCVSPASLASPAELLRSAYLRKTPTPLAAGTHAPELFSQSIQVPDCKTGVGTLRSKRAGAIGFLLFPVSLLLPAE